MTPLAVVAALAFAVLGTVAERVASVWPAEEASRRGPGWRTALLAIAASASAFGIVERSTLPPWATVAHLGFLAILTFLAATDLEQRRLPHVLLDPLIVLAIGFIFINPSVSPLDAMIGATAAIAFLGILGLLIRSGVALGDLYLVAPMGLIVGWPAIFVAVFIAALLSSVTSLVLLASRRVSLRSYIPFGPFLVGGMVLTLLRDERLLGAASAAARVLGRLLGA